MAEGMTTAKADTLQDEAGRIEANLVRAHELLDRIVPSDPGPETGQQPSVGSVTDIIRRCLQDGKRLNERLEELGARTGVI